MVLPRSNLVALSMLSLASPFANIFNYGVGLPSPGQFQAQNDEYNPDKLAGCQRAPIVEPYAPR